VWAGAIAQTRRRRRPPAPVDIVVKVLERVLQIVVLLAVLVNVAILVWFSSGLWRQSVVPTSAMVAAAVRQQQALAPPVGGRHALDYQIEPLLASPAEGPAWVWLTVRDVGGELLTSGLVRIDASSGAEPMVLGNLEPCKRLTQAWLDEHLSAAERQAAEAVIARECR